MNSSRKNEGKISPYDKVLKKFKLKKTFGENAKKTTKRKKMPKESTFEMA